MEKKKPRKKKSMSMQIKSLRKKNNELEEWGYRGWRNYNKEKEKLEKINKILPKKYFKIKFKSQSSVGHYVESEQIRENFTLNMAIDDIKEKLALPQSFELIDVKILN